MDRPESGDSEARPLTRRELRAAAAENAEAATAGPPTVPAASPEAAAEPAPLGEGGGQVVSLDLGKNPAEVVKYTVGWSNGTIIIRRGDLDGDTIVEDKLQSDSPHVMLVATQDATLLAPPQLNRQ